MADTNNDLNLQSQDRDQRLIEAAMKSVQRDTANKLAAEPEAKPNSPTSNSFSQDQVNAILAEHKRGLQADLDSSKASQNALKAEVEQFKTMLQEAAKDAGYEYDEEGNLVDSKDESGYYENNELDELDQMMTPPKGVNKELWKMMQGMRLGNARSQEEYTATIQAMREELASAKQIGEEERKIRLATEDRVRLADRDRMLDEALTAANCADLKAGRRYFSPDTKYVEGKGWMFVPTGAAHESEYMPFKEGVRTNIPAILQRSAAPYGGSGSLGTEALSISNIDAKINEMRVTMQALADQATTRKDARSLSAYQAAKRSLGQLEAQKAGLINN